ncbi:MAG: hypothetical protein IPJ89_01110 [Candidatus Iainarchaeum archaeon]|uniref:KaiC-like domain-containing protein n=1 Tax=Candidatus Iainarchaeum sp. TaxID=3101447 RepID=A0A7T9I290_9ARCH|nr:MAG: hypothetical protein IPJ89_01110 [Candidatus Diapherotrites archaeon]
MPSDTKGVGNQLWTDDKLIDFLKPGKEQESKLASQLSQLPAGTSGLLIVPSNQYSIIPRAVMEYFSQKNIPGVYVCVNRPYLDLVRGNNPSSGIKFVDVVTALTGKELTELPNVQYLDSPLALVEMDMAISENMQNIASNQKFLFVDSVSTLLVYNSPQAVEKFCHTIISKNRNASTLVILLALDTVEHKNVLDSLHQFVDQSIVLH